MPAVGQEAAVVAEGWAVAMGAEGWEVAMGTEGQTAWLKALGWVGLATRVQRGGKAGV
jgi:hypothetical protein